MDVTALQKERDLYLRLLNLSRVVEIRPLLAEALSLIVDVTEALHGYLEVNGEDDAAPPWWIAHGFTDAELESVRGVISSGIVAEAIATGKTIVTQSALDDSRFSARASVRAARIRAVLCAPVGHAPPRGVLYLEGRVTKEPFSEADRSRAELFADHLAPLVDRLLSHQRAMQANDWTGAMRSKLRIDSIIGRSSALAAVLKEVSLVAPIDVNVLLTGDSGTGKSQLARVIHDNSPRAGGPFVELNCAALPDSLVEQELFGAVAGAHSTATRALPGKVAAAERGTLFLDEIATMSLPVQAKLLQLLQSKQYYALGSARPEQADVRVIAATNTDLRQAVAQGQFREDLFFRLQVLPIRVPTLAERRDDIPLLAAEFCDNAATRWSLPRLALSPAALAAAQTAEWRGNVRELQHAIEAALIRAAGENAATVERSHLFPGALPESGAERRPSFQESTRRFQEQLLVAALEENDWNVAETARQLDLARSHLYTLINAFGLKGKRS